MDEVGAVLRSSETAVTAKLDQLKALTQSKFSNVLQPGQVLLKMGDGRSGV